MACVFRVTARICWPSGERAERNNIDDLFKTASVRTLYDELHRLIERIDGAVWRKVGSQSSR